MYILKKVLPNQALFFYFSDILCAHGRGGQFELYLLYIELQLDYQGMISFVCGDDSSHVGC
jgi:hypothetical protein